jgi:hypothetical protein
LYGAVAPESAVQYLVAYGQDGEVVGAHDVIVVQAAVFGFAIPGKVEALFVQVFDGAFLPAAAGMDFPCKMFVAVSHG